MKTKDIATLVALAVILIIVGVLLAGYFGKGSKSRSAEIEVVTPIDASFDQKGKEILLNSDPSQPIENFSLPIDLTQGLGNASPFQGEQ